MPTNLNDIDIRREGSAITVPQDVELLAAASFLIRLHEAQEQMTDVIEPINALPVDGAIALAKAAKELFGFANPTHGIEQGFFGPVAVRNKSISVEIGVGQTMQISWGGFSVPQIEGNLHFGAERHGTMVRFVLGGTVKKKHLHLVKAMADKAREIVSRESIYRGKSIRLPVDDDGDAQVMGFSFIDVAGATKEKLILNAVTKAELEASVFTRLEQTQAVIAHNIPLKAGILLAGEYGTGKTLTARTIANLANQHGWTFILVQRAAGLAAAVEIARHYSPAVVFAEDLDRVMEGEERNVGVDDVLNTIDGIEGKTDQVMVIMTTNHLEAIPRPMLRPGRIDSLVQILPPDNEAVQALIHLYAGSAVPSDATFPRVAERLAGTIPAFIAEVVRKSKLHAIARDASRMLITDDDLVMAAEGMQGHLDLMRRQAVVVHETDAMRLSGSFKGIVKDAVKTEIDARFGPNT